MTKDETRQQQTILIDALKAEAEYVAQFDVYTTASVWRKHLDMMAVNAAKLERVEAALGRP